MVSKGLSGSLALVVLLLGTVPAVAAPRTSSNQTTLLLGHDGQLQANSNGVGLAAGIDGSMGLAYRRYIGNTGLQFNILPIVLDHGDYLALAFGAQLTNYMLVWTRSRTPALTGIATALRLTGGTSVKISRDQATSIEVADANCKTESCKKLTEARPAAKYMALVAAGFGFEFGAIMRPGVSLALDLLMTVRWDDVGFYGAYPLPYGSLMYNW